MKVIPREVGATDMSWLALAGVTATIGFSVALVIAVWLVFGPVPALVVGVALSAGGTVWARGAEAETFARAQTNAMQQQRRFRDPEEDEEM